jgi:hypothetical protein
MNIPQPPGWERSTMMDSELIRFAMLNESLADETFAPNVVVTLESAPAIEEPEVVFDSRRQALESAFAATGLRVVEHTLCGLPAETLHYQTPTLGNVPPHPAIAVLAVLHTDNMTYAVSVTVQTTDPENPVYKHDAEEILNGFPLLPPSPS